MAHALNLTLPIKQDPETLERLQYIKAAFARELQPRIDSILRESGIIHFAKFFIIHDKYIVLSAEYDGNPKEYTDFFRVSLPDVFKSLFSLVEGAPPFDDLDGQSFFELSQSLDLPSLGESTEGSTDASSQTKGYLFSAYGNRSVREILSRLRY